MKETIRTTAQLIGTGVLVDINRIANALEELCRQGQIDRQYTDK